VLRGISLLSQTRKESNAMARKMFEQAIALDPNYAKAYARVAWTYFQDWVFGWTEGPGSLDRALEAARKAVAVDDSSSEAHLTFGWNLLWKKQQDLGVAQLEKAVSLDPNSSEAYAHLAQGLNFAGRPDEAIGFAKKAMRLDPNYASWVAFYLGESYRMLRRYDEAIAAYQEAIRRNPDFPGAHESLAGVYAELGQEKEARAEAAEVLRINPGYSLNWMRDNLPFKNQADLDRIISGSRKAGLR